MVDTKHSALGVASAVVDADQLLVLQSGVNKRNTLSVLWTYLVGKFGTGDQLLLTAAEREKLGFLTVTQGVDLDSIETRVNGLDAAIVLKGTWDATSGVFPGSGTAQAGDSYIVSVSGTVDGIDFSINDRIVCILDNGSVTTFAANWFKADYTDLVISVAGLSGTISASGLRTALNVEDAAAADQTAAEIEALLDTYYGDTSWRTGGGSIFVVADTTALTAIAEASIANGDLRLVESENTIYRYSSTEVGGAPALYPDDDGDATGAWVPITIVSFDLTNSEGDLPIGNLDGGTSAGSTTFWRGDGVWATPNGAVTIGSADPVSAPSAAGVFFIDTTGPEIWYAKGAVDVADWVKIFSSSDGQVIADLLSATTLVTDFLMIGDTSDTGNSKKTEITDFINDLAIATRTATETLTNKTISNPKTSYTPFSAGTKSSGTYTPNVSDGNIQTAINGGAHTLAPPSTDGTFVIQYTNNGSAGAITTSGFTKVDGATITTVDADDFFFYITKIGTFSHLNVVAMQ